MVHYLLSNARPPFSDWVAQVDRIVSRARGGTYVAGDATRACMRYYYDAGLSPDETASDWLA